MMKSLQLRLTVQEEKRKEKKSVWPNLRQWSRLHHGVADVCHPLYLHEPLGRPARCGRFLSDI